MEQKNKTQKKISNTSINLLNEVGRIKAMMQECQKWQEKLIVWQQKLEDREKTLRSSYLEVKRLKDGG